MGNLSGEQHAVVYLVRFTEVVGEGNHVWGFVIEASSKSWDVLPKLAATFERSPRCYCWQIGSDMIETVEPFLWLDALWGHLFERVLYAWMFFGFL